MRREPFGKHGEVHLSDGGSGSEDYICQAGKPLVVHYSLDNFCDRHCVPTLLGFRQGLGLPQPKIQESMAQRRLDSEEEGNLLLLHCETHTLSLYIGWTSLALPLQATTFDTSV